jgi:uncharacterized protein
LTRAAARRIALTAQGFGRPRPARPPGPKALGDVIRRLGLLQLDSVNVFSRSHYMPVYARVGPYDRAVLDRLTCHDGRMRNRGFVEYWAHEASLIPVQTHPLLRWRMSGVESYAWGGISRIAREQPELVAEVRQLIVERGPIRASDTGIERQAPTAGQMWNWHDGKRALEYLFFTGQITSAGRLNFERRYDLTERILPAAITQAPTPSDTDAQRELTRIAAKAMGVATEPDLGDYFRLPRAASKARVAELVEGGELLPVEVDGWGAPAYLWPEARRPRKLHARALLSPFDSLIWFRDRAERLFDFVYRIEIYTPAEKRVYGYYVLPFLLGETLVARVDLKSDRQAGVLRVQGAYAESGVDHAYVADELAAELLEVAAWLGLGGVVVAPKGDLSAELASVVLALGA